MKRWLVMALLLALVGFGVQAQDAADVDGWRLRTPTAAEYLAAVPDAVEKWRHEVPGTYGKILNQPLLNAISVEINNYPSSVIFSQKFDMLSKAYSAVAGGMPFNWPAFKADWQIELFKVWLRENTVDFSSDEPVDIPGYSISVVRKIDFNGDGIDEIILDVELYPYATFLVLEPDKSLPEHYRIVSSPYWVNRVPPYDSEIYSISFQDITGDGLPEWTTASGNSGGPGMWFACGNYSIETWRHDSIVEIFSGSGYCEGDAGGLGPKNVGLDYVNLDRDPELEIQQRQEKMDSWGCLQTTITTYDWNGIVYTLTDQQTTAEDNLECAIREAEAFAWKGKSDQAIPVYEHGLSLLSATQLNEDTSQAELAQYAEARLVLAYMLTGQDSEADSLLGKLESQQPKSEMMATLTTALSQAQFNAIALCTAAYNVFWEYDHLMFSYGLPSGIIVGRDYVFQGMMDNVPPEPEKAGCDVPRLIQTLLNQAEFRRDQSAIEQLQQRGVQVERFLRTDMNQDGREEWLVWTTARVAPLFFAPIGDTYLITRPDVRRPNTFTEITTQRLPNGNHAVVDWAYVDTANTTNTELYYYDIDLPGYGYGCRAADGSYSQYRGTVRLFDMVNNQLNLMLVSPLCEKRPVEALFLNQASELTVWDVIHPNPQGNDSLFEETAYRWDNAEANYLSAVAKPASEATAMTVDATDTLLNDEALFGAMDEADYAIQTANFENAIGIVDHALNHAKPDVQLIAKNGLRYFKALALAALGRDDEALAAYVAIYDTAPESAWGMLAGLHVEKIDE